METRTEAGTGDDHVLCRHGRPRLLNTRLWGKERGLKVPYPVVCHLVDTGAYFTELWRSVIGSRTRARIAAALGMSEDDAGRELALWAALHDLGKISPSYQHSLSSDSGVREQYPEHFARLLAGGRYQHGTGGTDNGAGPHNRITHWTLPWTLEQLGYPRIDPDKPVGASLVHAIGQLLGGHHGIFYPRMERPQLEYPATYLPQVGRGEWREQRLHHVRVLRTLITNDGPRPAEMLPAQLSVVVLGAVMTADWMASEKKSIDSVRRLEDEECCCSEALAQHWHRARKEAETRVRQRGLERCEFAAPQRDELLKAAGFLKGSVHDRIARQLLDEKGPARAGLLLVSAPPGRDRISLGLVAASCLGRAAEARGMALALPDELYMEKAAEDLGSLAEKLFMGAGTLIRLHPLHFDGDTEAASELTPELSLSSQDSALAREWLTSRRRGLLAPLGVGVIDQFLPAVLPVPDNAVRLFALSDKVLVVDDVRPQEPRSHQLLCLLVEWLAALGASVVLLTDTLSGASADLLVQAYRRGARAARGSRNREEGTPPSAELPQPGWLHVDGSDGTVTPSPTDVPKDPVREISWREVRTRSGDADAYVDAVLNSAGDSGSTLVCCDSVEQAQRTFHALQRRRRLSPELGEIRLLHPRFPWERVQELVTECGAAHASPAWDGSVLVATPSFAEHLPWAFERVITSWVPLPSLSARISRGRNAVLLDAVERPGSPMEQALRERTAQVLRSHGPRLRLPWETAGLVRQVYDDVSALRQSLQAASADGYEARLRYDARHTGIPSPVNVHGDLYELTRAERGFTDRYLAATMGFERAYVLCVHLRGTTAFLDPEGTKEVPFVVSKKRSKRSPAAASEERCRPPVAELARHVIPIPAEWAPTGGISAQIGRGRFKNIKFRNWEERAWLNHVYPVVLSGANDSTTGLLGDMRLDLTDAGLVRLD
ncbi:CRISPR-associated endonuclease Cas3'' [Nocardiopsis alba]|uniref:CRISPR-associated endonuclease Cas3'' n=1 Tax=Nocardiopsis alba TaxID=53437 RepID=UPI003671E56C